MSVLEQRALGVICDVMSELDDVRRERDDALAARDEARRIADERVESARRTTRQQRQAEIDAANAMTRGRGREIDRLEEEVKALRESLALRTEMHDEHKAELRAARDEIAALCAHRASLEARIEELESGVPSGSTIEGLRAATARIADLEAQCKAVDSARNDALDERDRARASAIEWANTPIHRLLTAYNDHRPRFAQPGTPRNLMIVHDRDGSRWNVSWEVLLVENAEHGRWELRSSKAPSFDEAVTSAARMIEAQGAGPSVIHVSDDVSGL